MLQATKIKITKLLKPIFAQLPLFRSPLPSDDKKEWHWTDQKITIQKEKLKYTKNCLTEFWQLTIVLFSNSVALPRIKPSDVLAT